MTLKHCAKEGLGRADGKPTGIPRPGIRAGRKAVWLDSVQKKKLSKPYHRIPLGKRSAKYGPAVCCHPDPELVQFVLVVHIF